MSAWAWLDPGAVEMVDIHCASWSGWFWNNGWAHPLDCMSQVDAFRPRYTLILYFSNQRYAVRPLQNKTNIQMRLLLVILISCTALSCDVWYAETSHVKRSLQFSARILIKLRFGKNEKRLRYSAKWKKL